MLSVKIIHSTRFQITRVILHTDFHKKLPTACKLTVVSLLFKTSQESVDIHLPLTHLNKNRQSLYTRTLLVDFSI